MLIRFWPEGRLRLWEEKLQLRTPFAGNAATQWGTVQEDVALKCYTEVSGLLQGICGDCLSCSWHTSKSLVRSLSMPDLQMYFPGDVLRNAQEAVAFHMRLLDTIDVSAL
jgi:hypothetical protein